MPNYAPHYTARYRVRYTAVGQSHNMTFRVRPTATPAERAQLAKSFLDALAPFRTLDWAVIGADYAGENSTVFLPAEAPAPIAGAKDVPPTAYRPLFMSFQGRGTSGARARVVVFGVSYLLLDGGAPTNDYRLTSAESPVVAAAVAALNDPTIVVAIDRSDAVFYPYVNLGLNAYYQRKQRG